MNQQLSLERMVDAWMADEAALGAGAAEQLSDQIIAATGQQRPRPRWLALLQESPMRAQTQVVVGSPTRRLTFVVAAVVLAALVAAGIAGAILLQPQPPASDDWPGFRGDASRAGFATSRPDRPSDRSMDIPRQRRHTQCPCDHRRDGPDVPSDDGVLSALARRTARSGGRSLALRPLAASSGRPTACTSTTETGSSTRSPQAMAKRSGQHRPRCTEPPTSTKA